MKRRVNAQSKQSKKILTVGELKTWLDGYCSAHDDDWTPTADQWNMIKDKVFSLADNAPSAPVYAMPSAPAPRQMPQQNPPMPAPTYPGAGAALPPPPSSLSEAGGQPTTNASGGMIGVSDRPASIVRDGKIVTPNKDTPGGPSDFA